MLIRVFQISLIFTPLFFSCKSMDQAYSVKAVGGNMIHGEQTFRYLAFTTTRDNLEFVCLNYCGIVGVNGLPEIGRLSKEMCTQPIAHATVENFLNLKSTNLEGDPGTDQAASTDTREIHREIVEQLRGEHVEESNDQISYLFSMLYNPARSYPGSENTEANPCISYGAQQQTNAAMSEPKEPPKENARNLATSIKKGDYFVAMIPVAVPRNLESAAGKKLVPKTEEPKQSGSDMTLLPLYIRKKVNAVQEPGVSFLDINNKSRRFEEYDILGIWDPGFENGEIVEISSPDRPDSVIYAVNYIATRDYLLVTPMFYRGSEVDKIPGIGLFYGKNTHPLFFGVDRSENLRVSKFNVGRFQDEVLVKRPMDFSADPGTMGIYEVVNQKAAFWDTSDESEFNPQLLWPPKYHFGRKDLPDPLRHRDPGHGNITSSIYAFGFNGDRAGPRSYNKEMGAGRYLAFALPSLNASRKQCLYVAKITGANDTAKLITKDRFSSRNRSCMEHVMYVLNEYRPRPRSTTSSRPTVIYESGGASSSAKTPTSSRRWWGLGRNKPTGAPNFNNDN